MVIQVLAFGFTNMSVHGEWFGSAPASSCPLGRHHAFSFAFFPHSLHSPPSWVTWDGLVHMGCHSSSLTSELRNSGRCQAEPIVNLYLAISLCIIFGYKMNINNAYAGFGKYVTMGHPIYGPPPAQSFDSFLVEVEAEPAQSFDSFSVDVIWFIQFRASGIWCVQLSRS